MIQTRNSFKKRRRLSARSDETKADETTYSESEDVFEDEITGDVVLTVPSSPTVTSAGKQCYQENDIPKEIFERYQQVVAEEENISSNEGSSRKVSRWGRVKKAFLTSSDSKGNVDILFQQQFFNKRLFSRTWSAKVGFYYKGSRRN